MNEELIIEIKEFSKVFRVGFLMRKVHAVQNVSLQVRRGEIFGLLGPNGAGKTTTLKAMMSLIRVDHGEILILGKRVPDRSIYRHIGFLPENPYFYDYLRPLEFLDYQAALYGLPARTRRERAVQLLARVGLRGVEKLPLRKFSKGMLQRIGLAQALIGDPKILILDEPMSGLDPIGRKEVRDLLLSLKKKGITILFSSHILSDVESICDRVAIMRRGVVTVTGDLASLLKVEVRRTTFEVAEPDEKIIQGMKELSFTSQKVGRSVLFEVEGEDRKKEVFELLLKADARIVSVVPHRETLEDIFIRDALKA
jgi:ABC-2 type transport system ATP-binding protein